MVHVFSPEANQFFLFNKTNKQIKNKNIRQSLSFLQIPSCLAFIHNFRSPYFSSLYSLDSNPLPENVSKLLTAISSSIDCRVSSKPFLFACFVSASACRQCHQNLQDCLQTFKAEICLHQTVPHSTVVVPPPEWERQYLW